MGTEWSAKEWSVIASVFLAILAVALYVGLTNQTEAPNYQPLPQQQTVAPAAP